MFNQSLTIANSMQSNITNSMRNNIASVSLMSGAGNHNSSIQSKSNVPVRNDYITPIVCGTSRCGSIKNNILYLQFCQ